MILPKWASWTIIPFLVLHPLICNFQKTVLTPPLLQHSRIPTSENCLQCLQCLQWFLLIVQNHPSTPSVKTSFESSTTALFKSLLILCEDQRPLVLNFSVSHLHQPTTRTQATFSCRPSPEVNYGPLFMRIIIIPKKSVNIFHRGHPGPLFMRIIINPKLYVNIFHRGHPKARSRFNHVEITQISLGIKNFKNVMLLIIYSMSFLIEYFICPP